ncbi:hypothetical protein LEP1GSC016_2205 [Leptospira borgpetersenii serovar Hardjo-bovis str. Sponselee]|uniref:Uncharacterized protein n=3 Tax=Leptospira borgpetersenii TaxID=174 RepID=M6BHA9_LEPBO|nr:hypothetical protein LEP1GSC016_2205 [Leptospira borgpetersenii serovar Hardjo-bovis str. Sponselee]
MIDFVKVQKSSKIASNTAFLRTSYVLTFRRTHSVVFMRQNSKADFMESIPKHQVFNKRDSYLPLCFSFNNFHTSEITAIKEWMNRNNTKKIRMVIHFTDETGIRSDSTVGKTYNSV